MKKGFKNPMRADSGFHQYFFQALTAFLVIAAAILLYFFLARLNAIWAFVCKVISVLSPIFYGLVIAYILNPIMSFFERHIGPFLQKHSKRKKKAPKITRVLCLTISMLIGLSVLFVLFYLLIPQLINSIINLVSVLPVQIDQFLKWFNSLASANNELSVILNGIFDQFKNWLQDDFLSGINTIAGYFASGVMVAINVVINLFFGIVVSVYVLHSKEMFARQIKKLMHAFLRENRVERILSLTRHSHKIFSGFIVGKLIDSMIIGAICFLGCALLRIPYALLVSVIIGLTNIIPIFGPFIGGIPSALLILLTDPLKGLYFIIFIVVLQQVDGNIIGPRILGESTGLSAFWVMIALLVGGGFFGVFGMIIAVPTFAVLYYLAQSWLNQRLKRRGKSTVDGAASEAIPAPQDAADPNEN